MGDRERSAETPSHVAGPPIQGERGVGGIVPFGLDRTGTEPWRRAWSAVIDNADRLPRAWRILAHGVCDGCSLGPRGLRDDVLPGPHLCLRRLEGLRAHTMGALEAPDLDGITGLRRRTPAQLEALGRLPWPFLRRAGERRFARLSWGDAVAMAGAALRDLEPTRTAWLCASAAVTDEDAHQLARAARVLGSPHVDSLARLDVASSDRALRDVLGAGAATCGLADLIGTDLLLVWGTSLAGQPMVRRYLQAAKAEGTRVVCIDPARDPGWARSNDPTAPGTAVLGTRLVDDAVRVARGGDAALIAAILKTLDRGPVDRALAEVEGAEALRASLDSADLDALVRRSGAAFGEVDWLARLIGRARTLVSIWGGGLERQGPAAVRAVATLHLARDAVARPRCGLLPIAGTADARGLLDGGVAPDLLPGRALDDDGAAALQDLWGHPVCSDRGLRVTEWPAAARRDGLDWLYVQGDGTDWTGRLPAELSAASALERVRYRVHATSALDPSVLVDPPEDGWVLLLPVAGRYEHTDGRTVTSAERRIRFEPPLPDAPTVGEARAAWSVPGLLVTSARPELGDVVGAPSASAVRERMAAALPGHAGVERLAHEGDALQWGGPRLVPPHPRVGPLELDLDPPAGADDLQVVASEGAPTGRAGVSERDALRLGVADGQSVLVEGPAGSLRLRIDVIDLLPGHVRLAWPECTVLGGWVPDAHTGVPRIDTVVTLGDAG